MTYVVQKTNKQNAVLQASAAQIATGAGAAMAGLGVYREVMAQLDVTAVAAAATDTLDAYLQTTIDGVNWIDIARFPQVVGNGGVKRFLLKVVADALENALNAALQLPAGQVRNILGDQYRVRWDIAGGTANFTFSVAANLLW